jgi:hypothetical protein
MIFWAEFWKLRTLVCKYCIVVQTAFLLIALLGSIFRGDEGLSLSSIVLNDQWIDVIISRFQL